MASGAPFEHTLRALADERGKSRRLLVTAGVALFVLWSAVAAWLEVPVTVSSVEGRIVSGVRQTHIVSLTTEPIVEIAVGLGDKVMTGDVLVRFDSKSLELELTGTERTLATRADQLRLVREERVFRQRQHEAELGALANGIEAARARISSSRARIKYTTAAEHILREMRSDRQIDELEYLEAVADLETAERDLDVLITEMEALKAARSSTVYEWEATDARSRQEEAALLGSIAELELQLAKLQTETAERTINAPDYGVIEGIADISVGQSIPVSEWLMTIGSDEDSYFEASFSADEAAGRISVGSPATISFDALPWTEHGRLPAKVARIGNEESSGRIRIYLSVDDTTELGKHVEYGLTGMAAITVAETTLFERLLRLVK